MRNKSFFILILVLSFGLTDALAQTSAQTKSISGGVLNGKAASLPKPSFPAAARAVGASGAVNVQVVIDENGDVVSAEAISGHPLLQQAAVQAARGSKFSPTKLEGQPVRVTGVIVYNFIAPMTFTQIGYELSLAERSLSFQRFQANSIRGSFPKSWEEENEDLAKLDSYLNAKNSKDKSPMATLPKAAPDKSPTAYKGILTVGAVGISSDKYTLDAESVEIIKQLQSRIENRISPNENILWSFKLGKVLGKLKAEIENSEEIQANVSKLNELSQNAPSGISGSVLSKIKEIVESNQQAPSEAVTKEKLETLIENLRNLKGY
jgi:TonB family protein